MCFALGVKGFAGIIAAADMETEVTSMLSKHFVSGYLANELPQVALPVFLCYWSTRQGSQPTTAPFTHQITIQVYNPILMHSSPTCRIAGRHAGEQIACAFDEIVEEYKIGQKINYIITDNAANMKCAFKGQVLQQQSDES